MVKSINGLLHCVVQKKIPTQSHERSLEIPWGRGVLKVNILEAKYEANLEFVGGGGCKTKTLLWGGMDIFWNCTFCCSAVLT